MTLRTALIAVLLVTPVFLFAPAAFASDGPEPVCPTAASPLPLLPGVPVLGYDGVTGTAVASDCYFVLGVLSGEAVGKQLRVTVATVSNHDVFVKEDLTASAAPYGCSSTATTATSDTCTVQWPLVSSLYSIRVKRTATVDSQFTLTAFLEDAPSSGCGLGDYAITPLVPGIDLAGSLGDTAGARCVFTLPANPLANPANPGDDLWKFSLTPSEGNFDLFVRRGLPAQTVTAARDCQSILTGTSVDVCEVGVGSNTDLYAMVRRTSGSGDFSLLAQSAGNTCGFGSGYHALPNGVDVHGSTRAVAGSTQCYFKLASSSRDDLLSVVLETETANVGYSLTLAKDHPIGTGPNQCTGTSSFISIPSLGLVLNTLAQCDILLEDGLPHDWFIQVARAATAGASDILFNVKGTAQQIPTLLPGVPQTGHVDTGGVQYWKVVLPENATFLDIQTVGDPTNLGCSAGSAASSYVALACTLLPFPKLVGCALAAGYGVSCDQAELTLEQRCTTETGDAETCAQVEQARLDACAALNDIEPGSCLPADSSGSVSGTCGIVNRQTGEATCDPLGASVKTTEMDLIVRHRYGLPTTAVNDCRSAGPGAAERCLFSADVKEVHDNTTEPARADVNQQVQDLRAAVNENRTSVDDAVAALAAAIAENRTGTLEPLWDLVRELVLGLTGQDPGALPATPAIPAVPATPNAVVPDQANALPLPGPGKYFIAVRGPLDLASSLFYQGGDYAIVALHDALAAPERDDVLAQVDAALGALDRGAVEQCQAQTQQPAACAAIETGTATSCEVIRTAGFACTEPELSAREVEQALCDVIVAAGVSCTPPPHSLVGVCVILPEACAVVDGVLVLVDEVLAQVEEALGLIPPVDPAPAPPTGSDPQDLAGWLLGTLG